MHGTLTAALLLSCLAQDVDLATLAQKCGSEIDWIADSYEPRDQIPGWLNRDEPSEVDRVGLLQQARKKAADTGRLVLLYVYRIHGRHMYRSPLLDRYMKSVVWSDEAVVSLVKRSFVPLRLTCDDAVGEALGLKAPDVVEPMIVVMNADGRILQTIHRIRTFNADWMLAALSRHLPDTNGHAPPRGEQALAALKERQDPEAAAERGWVLLRMGRLEDARKELSAAMESKRAAEAKYHLSVVEYLTGQESAAVERWRDLARNHSDTHWGWKAAMNLSPWKDTTPEGPLPHAFEDVFWAPEGAYEKTDTTRWARTEKDVDDVARRAVEFLLLHQRSSGGWTDTRYAYWDSPKILPNVRVAVSALACTALLEWRDVAPDRVDQALARGERYIFDDKNLAPGRNEECYADAYRLLYLARKHARAKEAALRDKMDVLVKKLELSLKPQGLWWHEYSNPFATAAVISCLLEARAQGASIPERLLAKAAEGLAKQRGPDGGYTYMAGRQPSPARNAAGRMPACEMALYACGLGSPEALENAMNTWWEQYGRFERVRVCDFHADEEVAGFFFFHDFFHATQAVFWMRPKQRQEHQAKFLSALVRLPEIDGSFIDDHEIGKSYGTAMALLSLRNALRKE
ncbi:MAG: hypothetical protein HYY16_17790 [Planctomycetes bacterium]|nr:hypothetical protein [Planctomycetota bacterium]